jgi:co-chaperonin GroES (HSP10)
MTTSVQKITPIEEVILPGFLSSKDPILPENFSYPVYDHVKEPSVLFRTMDIMDKRFNTLFPMLMGHDSPLFNPDPFYPIDHYKQRNRRVWTSEDIKNLSIEAFGLDCFDPEGIRLVIAPYEHDFKLFNAQGELRDDYHIGKVIKIGKQAFSTEKFISGPPCTFGDYVHFKSMNVLTSRAMNGKVICVVEDVAILGILDEPGEYYKSKDFESDKLKKFEDQIKSLTKADF